MIKTMKFLLILLILSASPATEAYAQNNADAILGKWTNDDKTRIIEFVKEGSSYHAIIRKAPDPDLLGKNQLTQLVFRQDTYNGRLWLPKKGKSYPCSLQINTHGSLEITAKAGFMSKTQAWTKLL